MEKYILTYNRIKEHILKYIYRKTSMEFYPKFLHVFMRIESLQLENYCQIVLEYNTENELFFRCH